MSFLSKYLNGKGGVDLHSGLPYIWVYTGSNGCGLWNSVNVESVFVASLSHLINKLSMYFRNPRMQSFMRYFHYLIVSITLKHILVNRHVVGALRSSQFHCLWIRRRNSK